MLSTGQGEEAWKLCKMCRLSSSRKLFSPLQPPLFLTSQDSTCESSSRKASALVLHPRQAKTNSSARASSSPCVEKRTLNTAVSTECAVSSQSRFRCLLFGCSVRLPNSGWWAANQPNWPDSCVAWQNIPQLCQQKIFWELMAHPVVVWI